MQIGRFQTKTQVEGPNKRAALWLQGCSIKCNKCCNPQFIDTNRGYSISIRELTNRILKISDIEGITILGGEPLDQATELLKLCQSIRKNSNLGIMLFTGYTWQQIESSNIKTRIIQICDLVIAGPFIEAEAPDSRRWIGSKNQTVHFISERYKYLGNTLGKSIQEIEFVISDDEILINGTPITLNNKIFQGLTRRDNI